jgi:hypothetical protein
VDAAEHFLDLGRLNLTVECLEGLAELGVDCFPCLGPLDEDGQVVAFLPERVDQIAILFEALAALQQLLRLRRVLPEIRGRGARFQAGQLVLRTGGFKDSSASPRRGPSGPHSGASDRQRSASGRLQVNVQVTTDRIAEFRRCSKRAYAPR